MSKPVVIGKLARTPLEYNLDEYGSHLAVIEAALAGEITNYDMDTVIRLHAKALQDENDALHAQLSQENHS